MRVTETHKKYASYLADQREFFDELVEEDRDYYFNAPSWNFTRKVEAARLLKNVRPARILDVGCGCGFHDIVLAEHDFVQNVVGIDYSPKSIQLAEQGFPHRKVHRETAEIESYCGPADFDMVVSFQVIEHHPNPREFIRHCKRLAKPGGWVAVVTPNRVRLDNIIRRTRGEPAALLDPQHLAEYSFEELCLFGRGAQLQPIDRFGHTLHADYLPWLSRLPLQHRCRLGAILRPLAHVIGIIFKCP